ncbi:MAG: Protein-N(5)-glutamine methyltransferase PrmC, methylates polypeptide chain release factors RF1 and RF2 [uncultured Sulfurovum sp.]|uniref:Protein-N(5)-glutamine methyltransferase PrmC, methylates polypeptide chain release factors RF1 and RF2 n=1 Tax=uncultured Sulfurovum sp. TaxID=269237 RepID=A0A6S6S3N7_9BACT|nr:MAG: Protein-N(5)-glutamine methyltransferase PrmC, methylates polypeptide chain release factors RF1 and RF2 [uncultured Sulfurovum sp.]
MNKDLPSTQADRPNIITTEIDAIKFYRKMDTEATVVEMIAGRYVIVEEYYSNGLQVLAELKKNLLQVYTDKSFQGQRDYRNAYREASHRLLVKIEENKIVVKKCPDIGWLEVLYPDVSEFYISFPEVQGMNSSWQWYEKGIEVKTLNLMLKPYYGTYFPTRFDHLKLFDKWLKKYEGSKENAIEIGVGSGVLSFQLIQNGFNNIFATDTNKNAIIGVAEEIKRLDYEDKLTLNHGDLFENCDVKADVVLFNPPWLLAKHKLEEGIDKAMYYEADLFPRFFEQAIEHLAPEGKVVLIFSNLAQVIDEENPHPIIEELRNHNRFRKELHLKRDVRASSRRTKRRDNRDTEKVELWVLSPKEK